MIVLNNDSLIVNQLDKKYEEILLTIQMEKEKSRKIKLAKKL